MVSDVDAIFLKVCVHVWTRRPFCTLHMGEIHPPLSFFHRLLLPQRPRPPSQMLLSPHQPRASTQAWRPLQRRPPHSRSRERPPSPTPTATLPLPAHAGRQLPQAHQEQRTTPARTRAAAAMVGARFSWDGHNGVCAGTSHFCIPCGAVVNGNEGWPFTVWGGWV